MPFLYHITDWPFAGFSPPASLQSEGFVHLCSAGQLLATAQRWYAQESEVGVMVLEEAALGSTLRWEDLYDHGEAFPHLYSEIPSQAVVGVVRLTRDDRGRYIWPQALLGQLSPLLEGPDSGPAFIEPTRRFPNPILPPLAVLCYFPQAVARVEQIPLVAKVHKDCGSAVGPNPILVLRQEERAVALCSPRAGAPLAAVALEELIALGCRHFVVCGGAGGLRDDNRLGQLVLVSEAFRDEGASHHYLPAAQRVATEPQALAAAGEFLKSHRVNFECGPTWTTDALYRETPARIARRRSQGCLTVEMECAALLAVAEFRKVPLVPLLSCGDNLGSESWDFRDWTSAHDIQDRLLWLAVEMALATEP